MQLENGVTSTFSIIDEAVVGEAVEYDKLGSRWEVRDLEWMYLRRWKVLNFLNGKEAYSRYIAIVLHHALHSTMKSSA